ncbi:hypothetical protein SAMN05421846_101388 [Chryseobacterium taeanense]|uniref:Uncharacterized protein n=1 Tax=Chryseobacterium taeanense TaxID=311334 RepID=A0A1G8E1E1_9FLAO|nr:hypothetical protein [Chryseobacterium taeanense]SDH63743.1 hypothetical protein SAMN05421846_101388 [Chryseobacterium taeanense]
MKIPVLILCAALFTASCSSTKNIDANLPKDISERPADESSQKYDQAQLDKLKASIESEIAKEKCTNAAEWTFAPMGTKACGGPQMYIAYPKKLETSILPKINDYTEKVKAFNQKYGIVSDCMMIIPPTSIKCIKGKAELVNS